MNKAFLIGRLTRDPELRYTNNQTAVANFSVAIDRPFKNRDGEQETDFINIEVWRRQAENCDKYLQKGSQVAIDGSIRIDNYEDKDGNKRQALKVVANSVQFLGTKGDNVKSSNDSKSDDVKPSDFDSDEKDEYQDFGESIEINDIDDEDLPF